MKIKTHTPEICRLFEAGETPRQIANRFGITQGYVREILNLVRPGWVAARLNDRIAESRNQQLTEQIALRILKGEPIRRISRETGMSYGAVWHVGRRNGMRLKTSTKHERAKRLAYLYDEMGMTQRELAAEFGMSQVGVSVAIRRVKQEAASA